ncbi:MAG TPA: hypothetical protein VGS22_28940 [Thermoanaerobaculia bacterium]|jgi:tetratricopeptide (TPR) repeat protein|nr:hypothetical protein [Thermoanaerobaculia bacterium]
MTNQEEAEALERLFRPGAVAVRLLLSINDWPIARLAAEAKCDPGLLSKLSRGERDPAPGMLERLAAAAGWQLPDIERLAATIIRARGHRGGCDLPSIEEELGRRIVVRIGAALPELEALLEVDDQAPEVPSERDRAVAEDLWRRLADLPHEKRRLIMSLSPKFGGWAFALRIAEESVERATSKRPADAQILADLGLEVATRTVAPTPFGDQVRALALGFAGNSHRIGGDFTAAEGAFLKARKLWPEGAPPANDLISEARLLSLEASLCRDQRKFSDALARLDRALLITPDSTARARLFLKQGSVFEQAGDFEGSIRSLEQVQNLEPSCSDRDLMIARLLQAVNLDHLGRHTEALEVIPAARQLATELECESNLLRLQWLEARAWAALGREDEAIEPLERVAREFTERKQLHDAALASLELAALYLDRRRFADTRALMEPVFNSFEAMKIRREGIASLNLFAEALRQETATAEEARRLLRALEQSRAEPGGG